jgi:hypothetical protein
MKKLFACILILQFGFIVKSQTLDIAFIEKSFSYSRQALLDSLSKKGFEELLIDEVYEEDLMKTPGNIPPDTWDRYFTNKGERRMYQLRKKTEFGVYEVTLVMAQPNCTGICSIFWNVNLRLGLSSYNTQLAELGYKRFIDRGIEKYINYEKNFKIIARIHESKNEINFVMSRFR